MVLLEGHGRSYNWSTQLPFVIKDAFFGCGISNGVCVHVFVKPLGLKLQYKELCKLQDMGIIRVLLGLYSMLINMILFCLGFKIYTGIKLVSKELFVPQLKISVGESPPKKKFKRKKRREECK